MLQKKVKMIYYKSLETIQRKTLVKKILLLFLFLIVELNDKVLIFLFF